MVLNRFNRTTLGVFTRSALGVRGQAEARIVVVESTTLYVHVLNAATGATIWTAMPTASSGSAAAVFDNDGNVVVSIASDLFKFRGTDGTQLWKASGVVSEPSYRETIGVYSNNDVFLMGRKYSGVDGSTVWTASDRYGGGPVDSDGNVYALRWSSPVRVRKLDTNGNVLWTASVTYPDDAMVSSTVDGSAVCLIGLTAPSPAGTTRIEGLNPSTGAQIFDNLLDATLSTSSGAEIHPHGQSKYVAKSGITNSPDQFHLSLINADGTTASSVTVSGRRSNIVGSPSGGNDYMTGSSSFNPSNYTIERYGDWGREIGSAILRGAASPRA